MTSKPGIPLNEPQTDRSECPICGDWRDSPTADCANCGWAIRPCGDVLGLCAYAGPHDGPHKIAGSWKQRLEREAQGIPLIDVELLAGILMDFGYDVPADRSQRIAERYAEDAARLASESSTPDQEARCDCAGWKVDCSCDFVRP